MGGHSPWRYALIYGALPAIPLIVIRPFLPESPLWRERKAAGTLQRPRFRELFEPRLRRTTLLTTLLVGCCYALAFGMLQHIPGVVPGLPQVAVLSGMYELVRFLGLYDHLGALWMANLVITLPFTVWVLVTFMRQLPRELEEAAAMDGVGVFTLIFRVFVPLLWPALAATGLLAFIASWNEFLFALTFTLSPGQRTVPVAIALLSGASGFELPWGAIMAASVIVTLPLVALVVGCQRLIVAGLTAGAVKG